MLVTGRQKKRAREKKRGGLRLVLLQEEKEGRKENALIQIQHRTVFRPAIPETVDAKIPLVGVHVADAAAAAAVPVPQVYVAGTLVGEACSSAGAEAEAEAEEGESGSCGFHRWERCLVGWGPVDKEGGWQCYAGWVEV